MKLRSYILKLALFATGLSGIVAEYILSTLATYFLGDSVFQWTMIVSIMMFSMGLGSRISRMFMKKLLEKFIYIEFSLSLIVSFASLLAYLAAAYTDYDGIIIYSLSIIIGIFIGMEIPLVIRLNQEFEILRINVSSVIEMDYYGSLLGGFIYAFVGLPYLGLTYTPFVLGSINFLVALMLLFLLWSQLTKHIKVILGTFASVVVILILGGFFLAKPIIYWGEQQKYRDKVIYDEQTRYQKIVITQWQNIYWLFINGNQQLSTLDEEMYHEPLVHPAMQLSKTHQDILVMGGGDGCAVRELLKYDDVKTITLVDLDPAMTNLGKYNPIIKKLNKNSFHDPKVTILNEDGYNYIEDNQNYYDVILIDLPDPKTVELGRLYTYEFYKMCNKRLRPHGVIVTQAGSPYYATKAFYCIDLSMQEAGFVTQKLHNQIITLGEWGWVLGLKDTISKTQLKTILQKQTFNKVETKWLNNEAMSLMTSFGKNIYINEFDTVEINRIHNPVLYQYYLKGNWDLY